MLPLTLEDSSTDRIQAGETSPLMGVLNSARKSSKTFDFYVVSRNVLNVIFR